MPRQMRCAGAGTGVAVSEGMTEQQAVHLLAVLAGRIEPPKPKAKAAKEKTTMPTTKRSATPRKATLPDTYGLGAEFTAEYEPATQWTKGPVHAREHRQPKASLPDAYGLGEEFTR